MIEAIVFDMDGLLFDSERVVQRSWNMAGEELGLGTIGDHIYNTLGMNLKSRTLYFKNAYGPDFPMEQFNISTRMYFREIADKEGVPLKPGVEELLKHAKGLGLKLAVATSSREEYSVRLLKDGGIYEYFDGFVFGDMVENAKPDPEIYLLACEKIGAKPENSIALEDSPNGIRAGYAAGMYPVMVPDLVKPAEEIKKLTYRVLSSLLEVIELLEKM